MIEVENLAEYRSLLRERNNAPWYQRVKHACMRQPAERKIIAAVLVCLSIGVTLIAFKKSFIDSTTDSTFNTDEDTFWYYNNTEEKELFLRLWNNANESLSQRMGLHEEQENGKHDQRSIFFAHCELIMETVKRSLRQCVSVQILPTICRKVLFEKMKCEKAGIRYRNYDGSCNNLVHTDWGMTGYNFNRMLKAHYADDVSTIRQSVYGDELPSVRHLSNLLFSHKNLPDSNITMFFVHFGLFLDHDLVALSQTKGNFSSCCLKDPRSRHPLCLTMDIAEDDPLYGPLNVTCKGFLRSPPFTGTCPGRREQENKMTAYLDISDMYGSAHKEGRQLRLLKKGFMRHSIVNDKPLLPKSPDSGNACYGEHANYSCFVSGDVRVNLLMPLMAVHTLWLREHNRLAAELSEINPNWDDETLYQEARKITIAEYQHIIYTEFLPHIFGSKRMKEHGLLIEEDKPYNGYDIHADAGIKNAFAAAAFRFGHTLVQDNLQLRDENYTIKSEMPLHLTYLNPTILYNHGLDDTIRGMIGQRTQVPDHYTTEQIRGRLLQKWSMTNGYDLTAMSLLRGRDHGVPPYLKWREFCKLPVPNSWEDMKTYMEESYVETLKEAYSSIEDIDLIPGGLGERHLEGALLGPTHICLIGHQFSLLRRGDRFWYENLNHPGAFTKESCDHSLASQEEMRTRLQNTMFTNMIQVKFNEHQLKEIYKITHARIVCDSSDNIQRVPKKLLTAISAENPIVDCEKIPKLDLSFWKEM